MVVTRRGGRRGGWETGRMVVDGAKARYMEGELVDVDGITSRITSAPDAVDWLSAVGARPVSVLNEVVARSPMRRLLETAAG